MSEFDEVSTQEPSPNRDLDRAIKALCKKAKDEPPEVAVKILTLAVNWEKVKAAIQRREEDFDPDNL